MEMGFIDLDRLIFMHPNPDDGGPGDDSIDDFDAAELGGASPALVPPRRTPRHTVRIVGIAVSTGAVAWMISIMVHAAAIAAGYLAIHFYFRPVSLPQRFAGGGGGGGLIISGADSTDAVQHGLPNLTRQDPKQNHSESRWTADEAIADLQWATPRIPPPLEHDSEPPIIGVSRTDPEAPRPVSPSRRAALSDSRGGHGTSGGPAMPNGNGGKATEPGLPGALLGHGLPTPDYPLESRRRGEEGIVKVEIEVMPDGTVGAIRILSGPASPRLRQAALAAAEKLRQYPFLPAYRFGQPVRGALAIPYQFVLK
jgi:TonB family protein